MSLHERALLRGSINISLQSFFVACLLTLRLTAHASPSAALPNIVIIFTDDQGYADVGVFGAKGFQTPNLDRLASQGCIFRNFHVAQPVCSASRAALLTGCYPNRLGIHGALGPRSKVGINDNEMTLAQLLKQRGYATAIFGNFCRRGTASMNISGCLIRTTCGPCIPRRKPVSRN
jgi:arylsulfatase A